MAEDITNPFLDDEEEDFTPSSSMALPPLPTAPPVADEHSELEMPEALPPEAWEEEHWTEAPEPEPLSLEDWAPSPAPEEDDWGFTFEDGEPEPMGPVNEGWEAIETAPPAAPVPPPPSLEEWGMAAEPEAAEDDWGFLAPEEPEAYGESQAEAEAGNSWDFQPDSPEEDPAYDEEDDALSRFLSESDEDEEPEEVPPALPEEDPEPEEEDPSEKSGLAARASGIWAQVMSDLRGGDAPEEKPQKPQDHDEGEEKRSGGILSKLLFPYVWLAEKIMGLLLLILSPLKKVPFLAPYIAANLVFKVISYAIPLLLIGFILHWQGSKPLPPPKELTFPDNGKAAVGKFGYDSKTREAYGTITNEGDVIAEVTPTFEVYSIQYGLNPLSFFFPKPNEKCVGKAVRIPIDGSKEVRVECPVDGSPKKITGELAW